MDKHVSAATRGISTEADGKPARRHVRLSVTRQRQRSRRPPGCRSVQRQTSEAGRSLSIHPGEAEILRCDAPDRRRVTGVKASNSAPDVGCRSAIIHEECVRPAAPSEKVGGDAAIQHVGAAVDCDSVNATAAVDEPVGCIDADVEAVRSDVDILVLQAGHRPGV